jgi:hypothetical protein
MFTLDLGRSPFFYFQTFLSYLYSNSLLLFTILARSMPPPKFDPSPYQAFITDRVAQGHPQAAIRLALRQDHGVVVSRRVLQRWLADWGVVSLHAQNYPEPLSGITISLIDGFVHRHKYNDTQIVDALSHCGIQSSVNQIKTLRLQRGWTLRNLSLDTQEAAWLRTKELCYEAVKDGPARNWGRQHLQTYLRTHYNFQASVKHVQQALKEINDARGIDRRPGMKSTRRFEALFHGPNYLWSIDGHSKLSPYGIDIYGAVDGYSRRLIWLYIGVSNQTQVSIAKQYLAAVEDHGIRPQFIRSDRGIEVDMLIDIQYNFYRSTEVISSRCLPQDVDNLPTTGCALLGKSTANQRIEQIWHRMLLAQLQPYRDLLRTLSTREDPLFISDYPSDRVVLLYIFMPLIRDEVAARMMVHNHRRIRKDSKRPHHVPGVPEDLWKGLNKHGERPRDYGIKPRLSTLQNRKEALSGYGRVL